MIARNVSLQTQQLTEKHSDATAVGVNGSMSGDNTSDVREQALQKVEDCDDFSNPAFKGAYRKGFEARLDSRDRTSNPYNRDNYGPQGVTFSRAFWRHWNKGFDDADRYLSENTDDDVETRTDGGTSSSDTEQPICQHREHAGDDVPAVAQYEGMHPPAGPTFRYWVCPDHEPEGVPALKRIDPGPENRKQDTNSNQSEMQP